MMILQAKRSCGTGLCYAGAAVRTARENDGHLKAKLQDILNENRRDTLDVIDPKSPNSMALRRIKDQRSVRIAPDCLSISPSTQRIIDGITRLNTSPANESVGENLMHRLIAAEQEEGVTMAAKNEDLAQLPNERCDEVYEPPVSQIEAYAYLTSRMEFEAQKHTSRACP
jgi:hypothetical protein